MPRNQFQRMIFALITVVITVNAYVFYSLYVINGSTLMTVNNASSVLEAIKLQGGVYMFGRMMPVWAVILIEFCFAYALEVLIGSPMSFKLACKVFNPVKNHPMIFETTIICATVGIMCPAMSFIASLLYYPYYAGFNVLTCLANWIKLVCYNFPFAYFSQLFFIQPLVRTIFKFLFRKDIENREIEAQEKIAKGENVHPKDDMDVLEDLENRITQIKSELEAIEK
jgi:hypothetical protein